ncbi:type IV-A pilus assembly ATPase PilB, partial [Pseudomonas aeruginosa]
MQLSGLSRQRGQANLLDEKTALQAKTQAQRNKLSLVTHLVQNKLVSGLALAELSAEKFGIAYCDMNSLARDSVTRDAISKKM